MRQTWRWFGLSGLADRKVPLLQEHRAALAADVEAGPLHLVALVGQNAPHRVRAAAGRHGEDHARQPRPELDHALPPHPALEHDITRLPLPPRSAELHPVEKVWQFLRDKRLSNCVFRGYDDIVANCCLPRKSSWTDLGGSNRSASAPGPIGSDQQALPVRCSSQAGLRLGREASSAEPVHRMG
jgi:hypothetical protein